MTTIATDGKSMAGDGQAEVGPIITHAHRKKVRRLDDASIVGCAGNATDRIAFCKWLIEGGKPPRIRKDEFAALVLRQDGEIEYFDDTCIPLPAEAPIAIGSGREIAIGAMEAGASPKDAVHIAAKRDPHTGGDITVLEI